MIHDMCKAFERDGVIQSLTHDSMDEQDTVCTKSVTGMYVVIWQYRILNEAMTGISHSLAADLHNAFSSIRHASRNGMDF